MNAKKGKPDVEDEELEYTDERGTRWTAGSYTTAEGIGETFGPGAPDERTPLRVREIRARKKEHAAAAEGVEGD